MRQWMLRITAYAERLLRDLDELDWPESLKDMQRNWIGRSEGAEVDFRIENSRSSCACSRRVPTPSSARPTWCWRPSIRSSIASPHPTARRRARYIDAAARKSDLERTELAKEKTGGFTGAYAINPVNGERIPVWIADYVLASTAPARSWPCPGTTRATGSSPAPSVCRSSRWSAAGMWPRPRTPTRRGGQQRLHHGLGYREAFEKVTAWLEEQALGTRTVNYKLRDWLFSRQRYWGEPFPVLHHADGTHTLVPDAALPVTLPDVESYKPSGTGESPLATITSWVETVDPRPVRPPCARRTPCRSGPARAGTTCASSIPRTTRRCSATRRRSRTYWMPVDLYVGGAEHAVLHLLYARFWHKVLFDLGLVSSKEPFMRLVNQGMILGEDGRKMSKSFGNVINPDDVIREYGADTLRLFEMFMGPLEQVKPWNTKGVEGVHRFLNRVWRLYVADEPDGKLPLLDASITDADPDDAVLRLLHKTIRPKGTAVDELEARARANERVVPQLEGKTVVKVIAVPDKLVNIVVK
jgi:leucyl-tRNA synthetase